MSRRVLAVLLLCCCALQSWAQAGRSQFRQLGIEDGLPSQQVNAIAQDRTGYLWIGTKDGLARFDGRSFKVYRHIPGDAASLPGNFIGAVHVDVRDRIWVAVEGHGLVRMDAARAGFIRQPLMAGRDPALDVWAIASDRDGTVWFGTYGHGLFRLQAGELAHFMPVPGAAGLPDENVLSLAYGGDGALWIATSSGIVRWRAGRFIAFDNSRLRSKVVINLMPDAGAGMWLGTQSGLNLATPDGAVTVPAWHERLSDARIMAVLKEDDGSRWFVASKGLNHVRAGRVAQVYPERVFITAFTDRDGGFWFGSDQGLIRQPEAWRHFRTYTPDTGPSGLRGSAPSNYQVLPDGSALVVGEGGIDRFWPRTGLSRPVAEVRIDGKPKQLRSVLQDRNGRYWLGGRQDLLRLDAPGARPVLWDTASAQDPTLLGPAKQLLQTPDGMIWITFYGGGVQARDGQGRVVHSITPRSGQGLLFPDPEQLFVGPDGQLWLVGGEGVLRWDPARTRFFKVDGAPAERLFSAYPARNGVLWLGGLGRLESYQWHAGSRMLRPKLSIAGDEGLPAVEISGIGADARGTLWLTSARGLLRLDTASGRVRQYGINDGLRSQEFDLQAPYIDAQGRGFAISKAGIVGFDTGRIAEPPPLRLVVEQVSVRREEDELALDPRRAIVLQPGDRDLAIDALLLDFEDVSAHRYRSRLSGYDPDWVEMGSSGKRVFSKLPDGHYRLELTAAGAEGLWSPPLRFDIRVRPPLWKTWWAMLSYGLVLLAAMALVVAGNRRRLKRRHAQQLEAQHRQLLLKGSEAKSQFLANLGHEIRTPMTGVLGMTELLMAGDLPEKPRQQVQSIKKAGEHLLRLMNDALDLSKIEAGQFELDSQAFHLPSLMQEVQGLLEPLARRKGLDFGVRIDPALGAHFTGDCGRIRQILYNLGSNAIKFTAEGGVTVAARPVRPNGLAIAVIDTGPGMTEAQQRKLFRRFVQADGARTARQFGGSGLGLAISKELAALMGGDIRIDSAPGMGATFILELPLDAAEVPAEARNALSASVAETPPRRLLLVEDDETIGQAISQLLEGAGHEVRLAGNALEALAYTAQDSFDAVLCDIDLPGMGGLELVRLWRAQGMAAPVIALTARTQSDAEQSCLEAGMDAFLRKPVSGLQLRQAIEAAVLS